MKITDIFLSGSTNSLDWCIANKAELKDNQPITSIINDDLCFMLVIEDLDFYQVFRLTQVYRKYLRIRNIDRANIQDSKRIEEYFPGYADQVIHLLNMGTSLVLQMVSEPDTIPSDIPRLFLPMMTSTFTIQIPFAFVDAIETMSEEEVNAMFTDRYVENIASLAEQGASHSMIRAIMIMIERHTANIRYDERYDKLLKLTKYFALKPASSSTGGNLFKIGLISFSRHDPITRETTQCSMFTADEARMLRTLKRLKSINAPTSFSFAIQLPIYHMQMLESQYSNNELEISHRSSINSIVDNGACIDELVLDDDNQGVAAYRVRLAELQYTVLKTISDISNAENPNYHASALFALMPPVYRTNAVITFTDDMLDAFCDFDEPVISAMFAEIRLMVNAILKDIG